TIPENVTPENVTPEDIQLEDIQVEDIQLEGIEVEDVQLESDVSEEAPTTEDLETDTTEDNFASLLDDAVAEASDDNTSLDELLENLGDEAEDDDEDLLIHDDMDPENALSDLLEEDTPAATTTDDSLLDNLNDLVSDDYSDILASTPEEHDDSQYEDKWALALIDNETDPSSASNSLRNSQRSSASDDLVAPDLSTIEAYEQGEDFSFTDIHESNRGVSSDSHTGEEYVDDHADQYVDDHANQYVDDTSDAPTNEYKDSYFDNFAESAEHDSDAASNVTEDIGYPDAVPGGYMDDRGERDTGDFGHLKNTHDSETLDGNLKFDQGVSLDIPAARLDPLELNEAKPSKRTGLWAVAALLLLVLAVAQTGWFRMAELARIEQLRPVYQSVCELAGCQLPGIQNLEQIRVTNTVFNPHRSISGIIVVDTLITNNASYAQPYPDLELEFRDLNGNIVAQRTFAPETYLAGDVLPGDLMPEQIPVHIALELVDPGPEAVTRQIYVRPNQ
ncbi:MAG: DUF3426 domain-containing protein, partial [Pseudomonadota bacterium]|nr:DUF3426 domain-containing protein [Pseudomonadota bacterium]